MQDLKLKGGRLLTSRLQLNRHGRTRLPVSEREARALSDGYEAKIKNTGNARGILYRPAEARFDYESAFLLSRRPCKHEPSKDETKPFL
jgi:hypothetical protein